MSKPLSRAIIQEQQLVAQYVAGKMSETEAEAFEDFCVSHPNLTAEVALEKKMQAGMAVVMNDSPAYFRFRANPRTWVWAAAACLLLALGGFFFVRLDSAQSTTGIMAAAGSPVGGRLLTRVRLAELRGAEIPSIGASSGSLVEIEFVAQFEASALYRVSLRGLDRSGAMRTIADLEGQRPSSAASLKVLMDGARIPAGVYSLVLDPDPPGRTLEFAFRKD